MLDNLISFTKKYGSKLKKIAFDDYFTKSMTNQANDKVIEFLSYCTNLEDVSLQPDQLWLKEDSPQDKSFLPKLKRIKIQGYNDAYASFLLRENNIRFLKCVVEYNFSEEMQHLIPSLASKMVKLEVARIGYKCDGNGLMILKDVTQHCHRTLKSIQFTDSIFNATSDDLNVSPNTSIDLTVCPNVTKLKLDFRIHHNISNYQLGTINNIILSFPNVINLNVTNYDPNFGISFDALTRLNKLQSIRLILNSGYGPGKGSCDSSLLSFLNSCPHLSYVFTEGFKQISCSTLDAIIEIAKTRLKSDLVIDLLENRSNNDEIIDGVKDSPLVSKYYTSLSQSEDKIPKNLLVKCDSPRRYLIRKG